MQTMVSYEFYTGFGDPGTVTVGKTEKPASSYSLILQGYPCFIHTKEPGSNQDVPPEEKRGSGSEYHYQITKEDESRNLALPNIINRFEDDSKFVTSYQYNAKLQQTQVMHALNAVLPNSKNITNGQIYRHKTVYFWESSIPGYMAAHDAPGLIYTEEESLQQQDKTEIIYKNRYTYVSSAGTMETNRLYYTKKEKTDGLDFEIWTRDEEIQYDAQGFGRTACKEGTCPAGMDQGKITYYQYAEKTSLPTAVFEGIYRTADNKKNAFYLHFENYMEENVSISQEGTLTSPWISIPEVTYVDDGFLAQRSIRCITSFCLIYLNEDFPIRPDKSYVFSCWRRFPGENWKYFYNIIEGSELKSLGYLSELSENEEMCHIMLRETECQAQINIYDPQTMLLIATIDNNGVPHIIKKDKLNRDIIAYTPEIILSSGTSTGKYYSFSGKAAISPVSFMGYSRFNGFNCQRGNTSGGQLLNSSYQFIFPKEGITIPMTAGGYNGLNTNTMFALGPWLTSQQTITVKKQQDTYKIQMSGTTSKLYINNIIVQTSEAYLADQSFWALFMLGSYTGLIVNGKLIISHVHTRESTITEVSTSASGSTLTAPGFHDIIVTDKVLFDAAYFDYLGNVVQNQKLRDGRAVIQQNFYDRRGNLYLQTAPAYYPLLGNKLQTSDQPLKYRSNFSNMDFSAIATGGMTGEIISFYNSNEGQRYCELPDDKSWPYTITVHETSLTNRVTDYKYIGAFNKLLSRQNQFHDYNSYSKISDFTFDNTVNFSSETAGYKGSDNSYTMNTVGIYNTKENACVTRQCGSAKIGTGTLTTSTHTAITASGVTNKDLHDVLYKYNYTNDNVTTASFSEWDYAQRKRKTESPNAGTRTLYYDSLGNQRLYENLTETKWKYAKYDIHGRTTQCGIFVPKNAAGLPESFITEVNNPTYPGSSDGSITPSYLFYYDGTETFQLGRLWRVENFYAITNIIQTTYNFNYLGQIVKYKAYHNLSFLFEKDCLGNIKKITYPSGGTLDYQYNDYAEPVKITYQKNSTSIPVNIMENGLYDLYGNLSSYQQPNNFSVLREWTMENHLTYAGPSDKSISFKKHYLGHWNPDTLVSIEADIPTIGKVSRNLEYNARGELSRTSCTINGEPHIKELTYDQRGNLLSLNENGNKINFTYAPNTDQINTIMDESGTSKGHVYYDSDGFINWLLYSGGSYSVNAFMNRDRYYSNKVSKTNNANNLWNFFTYDYKGNLLTESQDEQKKKIYYYNDDGMLLAQFRTHNNYGKNIMYIYCGNLLIAQYDMDSDVVTNLVYDDTGTLLITKDNNVTEFSNFLYMLFGDMTPFHGKDITFQYAGMHYLDDVGAYEDKGQLYFPQLGITSVAYVDDLSCFYSAYRKFGNRPLQ